MKNVKVKYLAMYDVEQNKDENRVYTLSAVNKVNSIIETLTNLGVDVEIVSLSYTIGKKNCPGHLIDIIPNVRLRLFSSIGRVNYISRIINRVYMQLQLIVYLITHLRGASILLVYHSSIYLNVIKWFSRLKRCKIILEMEEIYADVSGNQYQKASELKLASMADAYIFPTQLLDQKINMNNKPSAIIHGTYQVEPDRYCRFADEKKHVVYAGTLDPRKGGAVVAAAAARFLSKNYHVHILGFGSEQQIEEMRNLTKEISAAGQAKVTYDGLLSGEDYIRFIQSCDIGLSTQNPDAAFNATSFPSKVLSYMANGLRVVSIRIEAVECSAVGDLITYYDEQTPEEIAKAIMSVDMNRPYDSRKRITELDRQFETDLKNLIEAISNENY